MRKINTYFSDVLVVGGGIAGLYAANSATQNNSKLKVTLLTGEELGSGGCSKRTHGINAAMNSGDSSELHFLDTIKGGGGINNISLAKILCSEIIGRVDELEKWGVRFHKTDGEYVVGTYGGSSNSRSIHWYDLTGLEIVQELVKKSIINNIFIKEHNLVVDLLVKDDTCFGVVSINKQTNEFEIYYSMSVILATGGGACVYPISSISFDKLAFGIIMGFNAGVPVVDMEMVQFHPTGAIVMDSPYNGSLLEEEMRAQGGMLFNSEGHRYMFDYDDNGELATRDIVARSSYLEIIDGRGTENNGVIFDISKINKEKLKERFPETIKRLRNCNIDLIAENKIEVSPTAHFLMGGMVIDEKCETNINGLFACGEDAGGIHGGNRLGGNGVAGAIVFGYKAGVSASETIQKSNGSVNNDSIRKLDFYNVSSSQFQAIDKKIKKIMWKNVGLVRNGQTLNAAIEKLSRMQASLESEKGYIDLLNGEDISKFIRGKILQNKLSLSLLIAESAFARKNSLGAHFRSDSDGDKAKYNIITQKNEISGRRIFCRECKELDCLN